MKKYRANPDNLRKIRENGIRWYRGLDAKGRRRHRLKALRSYWRKYGLSDSQIMTYYNRACEVCGSNKRIGIDHDHETGIVRGSLCHNCNVALGLVKEDTNVLKSMVNYINERNYQESIMRKTRTEQSAIQTSEAMTQKGHHHA